MKVSVIIPTFNRAAILVETIARLRKQNWPGTEIVVVDDGSDSKNLRILAKIDGIKRFYQKHCGPAAARNLGIRNARGEVLIFLNDDGWVEEDFLMRHVTFHKNNVSPGVGLMGPLRESLEFSNPTMEWLVGRSNQHFNYCLAAGRVVPWYYFWTCNVSIKRSFLLKKKLYFDEEFPTAAWEDIEFAYRAMKNGLRLFYDKNLTVCHHHRFEFDDVLARFYSHGRGLYYLGKKLPDNFLPPLARRWFRVGVKAGMDIIGVWWWRRWLISWLRKQRNIPNLPMQLVVLSEKIKGYEYEKKL